MVLEKVVVFAQAFVLVSLQVWMSQILLGQGNVGPSAFETELPLPPSLSGRPPSSCPDASPVVDQRANASVAQGETPHPQHLQA